MAKPRLRSGNTLLSKIKGKTDGVQLDTPAAESKTGKNANQDLQLTWHNFYQHVRWDYFGVVVLIPIAGFICAPRVHLQWQTALWSICYFIIGMLGVTAGHHRLWSHRSYNATTPLEIFLALAGASAGEGSAMTWATDHRSHHRFTDTDLDPYTVNRGLAYAHILWMLIKEDRNIGRVDMSDLENNRIVMMQYQYYGPLLTIMAWIFPAMVAGLGWGDWAGGLVYAGILRMFFCQQASFCINSLAHYLGDQPYSDWHSPRDNIFTAIVTCGEGYHNFHHEFPSDYRNGIEWHHFDMAKWAIYFWKCIGLASDLKTFEYNEIEKGRIQQLRKRLDERADKVNWGVPLPELPLIDWNEFQRRVQDEKEALMAIEGVVYDVGSFAKEHPGGLSLIVGSLGKDATARFNGGVYNHSNAARNLLDAMRVARLRGGGEVEIWK